MPPAWAVGLIVLGACLVLSAGLVVLGVLRIVRSGVVLKKHLESYAGLPLGKTFALTEARLTLASRRADTIPELLARAHAALIQMDEARDKLREDFSSVSTVVRLAGALFGGR
jgi:hypothetical protein